jgi:hypothetical protein
MKEKEGKKSGEEMGESNRWVKKKMERRKKGMTQQTLLLGKPSQDSLTNFCL